MIQEIVFFNSSYLPENTFHIFNDEDFIKKGIKSAEKIYWKYHNEIIRINIISRASFYPFFGVNKIVFRFNNQPEFPHPNNLVIYNEDGTILLSQRGFHQHKP